MRLGGRLTRHFLMRVALLLMALGAVFLAWILVVAYFTTNTGQSETAIGTNQIVREAARETTLSAGGTPEFSKKLVTDSERAGVWVQVLDENGDELVQTGKPAHIPTHFTPGGLVLLRQTPRANNMRQSAVSTWVTDIGGRELTFVAGLPLNADGTPTVVIGGRTSGASPPTFWALFFGLLVAGAVTTIGVSYLFGRSLAMPPAHMMRWLSALAEGDFAEPVDRRGKPVSRGADGGLKHPYTTYREVFASLDTLTAKLRQTEEERARIEAARDEWLASVSHDLRTPLTSVQGYAEMLASEYDFDADEVRRQAGLIATQAGHMDELIDDMNLSFRLRADAPVLHQQSVDLVEIVREAAVDLANDPRAAELTVLFDEPAGTGAVLVSADATLLRRAIANLLVNAAVHNPAGTTVRASVARQGEWALVRVADDGVGMDETTTARLFDRYFRGTDTSHAEGTGLGMAITRQIAVAHGGRIDVASTPGAGTIVQIALPTGA